MRKLSEIQTIKTLPTTYLGMYASGSHWGMQANGNTSSWIRTTSNGIIPFEAGGASSLGTTDWPFNSIYSKKIYENGVDISTKYLPLAGGTMTGQLTINKSGDGATLLNLNTERGWYFQQGGSGGNTTLDLVSQVDSKSFRILDSSKNYGMVVNTSSTGTSVSIDGNKVYHAGAKPTASEIGAAASNHTHSYLPLSGGTMTGDLKFSSNGDTGERGIMGNMGANDVWRIFGGATARDTGYLEIATGDNGNEPIYFKQYESTTTGWTNPRSTVTLLDANGNSNFSGSLKAKALNSASTIKCAESIYVGDGSNGERSICFYSADGSYKCRLYGGNTNSTIAFGIYDSNASIRVLAYTPDTKTTLMQTDIVKMSGKLDVKEIACSSKMTIDSKAVLTKGNINKNITIGTTAPSSPSTGDIWISW